MWVFQPSTLGLRQQGGGVPLSQWVTKYRVAVKATSELERPGAGAEAKPTQVLRKKGSREVPRGLYAAVVATVMLGHLEKIQKMWPPMLPELPACCTPAPQPTGETAVSWESSQLHWLCALVDQSHAQLTSLTEPKLE